MTKEVVKGVVLVVLQVDLVVTGISSSFKAKTSATAIIMIKRMIASTTAMAILAFDDKDPIVVPFLGYTRLMKASLALDRCTFTLI